MLTIQPIQSDWLLSSTLHVDSGDVIALTGDSGSGKSRLLRSLADLDPNNMELQLNGWDRSAVPAPQWRQHLQYLPAEPVWWTDTAGATLNDEAKAWAPQIGISHALLSSPISQLSTGERQRCALLRALSVDPLVLLLDEPTAALDKTAVAQVEALLGQWVAKADRAIIWVSHDAEQRSRVGSQQWLIENETLTSCP